MEQIDRALKEVEIKIRSDGQVIWVNSVAGCIMRVCHIEHIYLEDNRPVDELRLQPCGHRLSNRTETGWLAPDKISHLWRCNECKLVYVLPEDPEERK